MTRKTFVIDTNVLLHDPDAIEKFTDNDVVMPSVVLEELDKLKRFSDELGKNARHVFRFIDQISGDLTRGVDVNNGVNFSIFHESLVKDREGFPLPLDSNKNKILFTAYVLKKRGRDVVIVVSKDFVLRLRAQSVGIESRKYSSLKEDYDHLYQGIRRSEITKGEVDQFAKNGVLEAKEEDYQPNEYHIFSSPEVDAAVGKYNHKSKKIEAIAPLKGDIWGLMPLNDEQRCALDLLLRDDIKLVTLIGQAGTGKTLLALTCGLRKVFDEDIYKKILVSRPIMPLGKDIGYLPGTKEEKIYHWMQPIYDNLDYLCESTTGKETSLETKQWIMDSEKIEMEAVTYIRGRSLANTWIIIDEAQNLTPHEVKTIISRAGHGTKVILTGDPTQIDNPYLDKDSNALTYIVNKFKNHAIYGNIVFKKTERSALAALAADIL